MKENRRKTGADHERQAAEFLKAKGYRIVEQNYRCRAGEIDIIAEDDPYLVFVEVKYRATAAAGYALEAIDEKKIARIRRTAAFYLYEKGYPEETPCRFDAVGVDGERITHIEHAF